MTEKCKRGLVTMKLKDWYGKGFPEIGYLVERNRTQGDNDMWQIVDIISEDYASKTKTVKAVYVGPYFDAGGVSAEIVPDE